MTALLIAFAMLVGQVGTVTISTERSAGLLGVPLGKPSPSLLGDLTDSSTRFRSNGGEEVRKAQASDHANAERSVDLATGAVGSVQIEGTATWYCSGSSACTSGYGPGDAVAAIDPALRIPRGTVVTVTGARGSQRVTIVDVCACKGSRIIDLTSGMFVRIVGPLSQGTGRVTIEYGGKAIPLPATDTAPDLAYWLGVVR